MKLLILTQYFPPEVGAPQNRLFSLARHLAATGVEVTVLTAMPNYPQMVIQEPFRGLKRHFAEMDGIKVHRATIFATTKRSITSRLRNYFSFVLSSARSSGRLEDRYDFVMCESPPLFLGLSALYLARVKKARLIFNVSDLWPESAERLGVVTNRLMLGLSYRLEAMLYKRSALVTGQTRGICSNISQRFPTVKTYWLPNGADLDLYTPATSGATSWRESHGFSASDRIFLYAGIIGLAQGLDVIVKAAELLRDQPNIVFALVGDGPELPRLRELVKEKRLVNVRFFEAVQKSEMPGILAECFASVIPLKKLEIFKGAIPSKIFECLAMEKPILLGVDGEARELFINEGNAGLFFEPENAASLAEAVRALANDTAFAGEKGRNGRRFVTAHFDRKRIAADFLQRIRLL